MRLTFEAAYRFLLLLSLALPCWVAAAETSEDRRDFQALDSNHDGVIEETEAAFEPALWAQFRKADTDHNLRISSEEFERWRVESVEQVKSGPRLLLPPARGTAARQRR
jgi:hypothetical protein